MGEGKGIRESCSSSPFGGRGWEMGEGIGQKDGILFSFRLRSLSMKEALDFYKSPVGLLKIRSDGNSITHIVFAKTATTTTPDKLTKQCISELKEYFDGTRSEFSVPMKAEGTEFQKAVWGAMLKIATGKTLTYANVARQIGRPKAVRAVGTACGANQLVVAIPCHRIVGSVGLGGYGGGLDKKKWLLLHEQHGA